MNICEAVAACNTEAVRAALDAGADINSRCSRSSVLIQAVVHHDRPTVELLLERGAKVDIDDFDGFTAFFYAVAAGDLDTARLIAERGIDTTPTYLSGELLECPFYGDEKGLACIEFLLSLGADLASVDRYGDGLLIRAVRGNCPKIIAWLLDHGFATDQTWSRGKSALEEARSFGYDRVVSALASRAKTE